MLALLGALVAMQSVALSGAAADHTMRPAHTEKLTPDTFDEWIGKHTGRDSKTTAFVRWMVEDDASLNCTWLSKGFLIDDPVMPEDMVPEDHVEEAAKEEEFTLDHVDDHYDRKTKQLKSDPCAVVREQAAAWNMLTKKHAGDERVVFGDVVLKDWPELVKKTGENYVNPSDMHTMYGDDSTDHDDGEHPLMPHAGTEASPLDGDDGPATGDKNQMPHEEGDAPVHPEMPMGEHDMGEQEDQDAHDPMKALHDDSMPDIEHPHDDMVPGEDEGFEHDPTIAEDYEHNPETMADGQIEDDMHAHPPRDPSQSDFEHELAEVAHNRDVGGCTIRHYNAEMNVGVQGGWTPHCLELLELHQPMDNYDDEGNIVPPTPEELENRQAEKGRLYLEQYLEDTVESLGYHFEQLEHVDQL